MEYTIVCVGVGGGGGEGIYKTRAKIIPLITPQTDVKVGG